MPGPTSSRPCTHIVMAGRHGGVNCGAHPARARTPHEQSLHPRSAPLQHTLHPHDNPNVQSPRAQGPMPNAQRPGPTAHARSTNARGAQHHRCAHEPPHPPHIPIRIFFFDDAQNRCSRAPNCLKTQMSNRRFTSSMNLGNLLQRAAHDGSDLSTALSCGAHVFQTVCAASRHRSALRASC